MNYMLLPLKRYAEFGGRSRRKEYWLYALFVIVGSLVASGLDAALGLGGAYSGATTGGGGQLSADFNLQGGILAGIWGLVNLIPGIAVSVRRLHDTDRSAWWILINFIPLVGFVVWIVFMCTDGTRGSNRFGADPKGGEVAAAFGRA